MFEKFTERARQVVVLAQEEARSLSHNYIGTEHILLGLLREEEGLAARTLDSLGVTTEQVRSQVVRIVGRGEEVTEGQIPFTPRAKKVLELGLRESMSLGHNYIGTEHILLGLARENEGVASRILLDMEIDAEKIRSEAIRMLSGPGGAHVHAVSSATGAVARDPLGTGWLDGVRPLLGRLAREMRQELGRGPDPGDLLLVLACATNTIAAQALRELGVDLDVLWGTIEKLRQDEQRTQAELGREIAEAGQAKEHEIANQQFAAAAELRDRQRELRERAAARAIPPPELLGELRRRLGIPSPPSADEAA